LRRLEIGPGERLQGFEGVDSIAGPAVDEVADARKLPYPDQTFDLVYASHVIEHFPWYETVDVLREWRRVIVDGGTLEVWTVNALVVARRLLEYEQTGTGANPDQWNRFNPGRNPYLWCSGRLFAYRKAFDGGENNWHKALFTPKHLSACLREAGFKKTRQMQYSEVRGHHHGPINMGIEATR